MDGKGIPAKDNLNVNMHPFWSQISVLDVSADGASGGDCIWVDSKVWDMETPKFTCSPPCKVKIPPWTSATSTVNHPLVTVSDGSWTCTITKAPLTISQWVFEPVTLSGQAVGQKRQAFEPFWPKPAATSKWPAVVYTGPDGSSTTTAPNVPFPTPPPSIEPFIGQIEWPMVEPCFFFDLGCKDPWLYGDNGTFTDTGDGDDFNENWDEDFKICPRPKSSSSFSSSTPTPTPTQAEPPIESPREGDPMTNKVDCYHSGQKTEHIRIDNTIKSFCNSLGEPGTVLKADFFKSQEFTLPSGSGLGVKIVMSLDIDSKCQWTWDMDECNRHLQVPVNSCNCEGTNGKQGDYVNNDCYSWRVDPNTDWG